MIESDPLTARLTLEQAEEAGARTRDAGRWYRRYLSLSGILAFAYICFLEILFPGNSWFGRVASLLPLFGFIALEQWAKAHQVIPRRGRRLFAIAGSVWFISYLLVVGPLLRWQTDESALWWALASAVMALPFFIAAWWVGRRG